ncbi:MAG: FemAB family XrtA/PEP-CTERM system-associated protein, partial [Burkholderiaceae bacterium]
MSAALQIKRLSAQDIATARRWDEFVLACPQASFFHRAGWLRMVEDVFGHQGFFLYAEGEGGAILGVLPLAQVKSRLFGHALVSLPFAVYGGVAASDELAADALEREAQAIAQRLGAEHLEFRNVQPRHADWPQQDLYVTFRKEILPDEEANMLAIPRKQRAMVRKGIKNGLIATVDADAQRFFALYADNVHRHGTPAMPKRYFDALLQEFGADAEVLTISGPDGRPLSSVLSFYFRDEVLPYYAGDDEAARDLAANDFKYWELMRRACERGTGSFDFKKNWGFEPSPLAYEYKLLARDSVPQNNPLNPRYRAFIAM